jgi:RNA polymerase sigma factor (sigma-70 family)
MASELVLDSVLTPASRPAPATAQSRSRPTPSSLSTRGRELLENNFGLIQQKLQHLSRRSGLPDHEAEELRSWVLLKLVENDYRVLASWQGRSSFSTYLTVVLVNLVRDYRIHLWGKWRPSAEARRQGDVAVLLERLWVRDGLPLDEAVDQILTRHGTSLSRPELERIARCLPQRPPRRRVGEEELQQIGIDGRVCARIEDGERDRLASHLQELLLPLLQSLPAEDRRLLKLHYWDGLSMAAIAPLLRKPQKALYSLRDRCLKKLRRALEGAGLDAKRVSVLTEGTLGELITGNAGMWECNGGSTSGGRSRG